MGGSDTDRAALEAYYGLPRKTGREVVTEEHWDAIRMFIDSRIWWQEEPCLASDKEDPLLAENLPFGAFMLGFDFHLTEEGVRVIEINTNAGGLAVTHSFVSSPSSSIEQIQRKMLEAAFVKAVKDEYDLAAAHYSYPASRQLQTIAIVDENVTQQKLYPEMVLLADLLCAMGLNVFVVSPEDLSMTAGGRLTVANEIGTQLPVDFLYNRVTDFRLEHANVSHIRAAAIAGQVVLSPHPAAYARIADKRTLVSLGDHIREKSKSSPEPLSYADIVPRTVPMSERSTEEWLADRKRWVFKPAAGNGSRGVYRGDRISISKLKSLPRDTFLAQEMCPPSVSSDDGTKMDFRVFTRDNNLLGMATRHYSGQVMEMRSMTSGFKMALPRSVCCMPQAVLPGTCSAVEKALATASALRPACC